MGRLENPVISGPESPTSAHDQDTEEGQRQPPRNYSQSARLKALEPR